MPDLGCRDKKQFFWPPLLLLLPLVLLLAEGSTCATLRRLLTDEREG